MCHQKNQQWRLASRPQGLIKESDFEWREEAIPVPGDGELLVRIVYLSLDPAVRVWVNDVKGGQTQCISSVLHTLSPCSPQP